MTVTAKIGTKIASALPALYGIGIYVEMRTGNGSVQAGDGRRQSVLQLSIKILSLVVVMVRQCGHRTVFQISLAPTFYVNYSYFHSILRHMLHEYHSFSACILSFRLAMKMAISYSSNLILDLVCSSVCSRKVCSYRFLIHYNFNYASQHLIFQYTADRSTMCTSPKRI